MTARGNARGIARWIARWIALRIQSVPAPRWPPNREGCESARANDDERFVEFVGRPDRLLYAARLRFSSPGGRVRLVARSPRAIA
jgi:hypothetical protein